MLLSHPDKPLSQHLAEVELAAMAILDRHPPHPFASLHIDARDTLHQLAGWHDIAKATSFFQEYIRDTQCWVSTNDSRTKTHTPLGAVLSADAFAKAPACSRWYVPLLMALCVRGHHGRLPTLTRLSDSFDQQFDLLERQSQNLNADVATSHPALEHSLSRLQQQGFEAIHDNVIELIDEWQEQLDRSDLHTRVQIRLAVQFCFSCLLEADKALLIHDSLSDFDGPKPNQYSATLVEDQLPPGDRNSPINQQRRAAYAAVISDAVSDLDDYRPRVLTLPTGLGKTRCAAGWALHWRARMEHETGVRPRILVVLPFLSVIEQTAKVYRELLGLTDHSNDVHLQTSHSLSLRDHMDVETESLDDNDKHRAEGQAEFMLDTWRSEIVLTTFDQFLLALMDAKSRHQQRFHNLCDALIVIDEVQAFPVHLWHPVGTLFTQLAEAGRTRFLLMTATQPGIIPAEQNVSLIADPAHFSQPRYRIELDLQEKTLAEWLPDVADEIAASSDVRKWLLVLNTRRCAQDVYRYFRDQRPELRDDLLLLSSDIVPRDRLARIKRIKSTASCIAITTQCVEAGVDIDMDRVIRDFAPLDSIVQVAGRCNRNGTQPRQTVRIIRLLNELENGRVDRAFCDYIYDPIALRESTESLMAHNSNINEEDVTPLVEDYFLRLGSIKDKGSKVTNKWTRFEHGDINIQRLLRGDNDHQITFVVEHLDPTLRDAMEAAYDEPDRWRRRRKLRDLGPRIAQVSVTAWARRGFRPDDVAEPFPSPDHPSFWFLFKQFYDEIHLGLCLDGVSAAAIL